MSRSGSKILHGYYNSMRCGIILQFVSLQPSSCLPLAVKWVRRVPGSILFTEKTRNDADRGNCYASSKPEHFHENQRCAVTHKLHILAVTYITVTVCNRMPDPICHPVSVSGRGFHVPSANVHCIRVQDLTMKMRLRWGGTPASWNSFLQNHTLLSKIFLCRQQGSPTTPCWTWTPTHNICRAVHSSPPQLTFIPVTKIISDPPQAQVKFIASRI